MIRRCPSWIACQHCHQGWLLTQVKADLWSNLFPCRKTSYLWLKHQCWVSDWLCFDGSHTRGTTKNLCHNSAVKINCNIVWTGQVVPEPATPTGSYLLFPCHADQLWIVLLYAPHPQQHLSSYHMGKLEVFGMRGKEEKETEKESKSSGKKRINKL